MRKNAHANLRGKKVLEQTEQHKYYIKDKNMC